MEFVQGRTLRELSVVLKSKNSVLPEEYCASIIIEVCKALEYAHNKTDPKGLLIGLVHRDISMENIMITQEGRIKVLDFGIAKIKDSAVRTGTGIRKGKLHYMSPEQASGLKVDHRSDLYSLGLVFYELLSGESALTGNSDLEILHNASKGLLRDLRTIPISPSPELTQILGKFLSPSVEKRFQNAGQIRATLLDYLVRRNKIIGGKDLAQYFNSLF